MNKWDSKRIAFISILIAMSISFVIIGTRIAAISSIPAFKLSLAGLPIKIIGFIFGPIIGFVIGFTTDIISFVFIPTFYYPLYSVALGISGMLPGVFALVYNYFYKILSKSNTLRKLNNEKVFSLYKIKLAISKNNYKQEEKEKEKYEKLLKKIDKIALWENEKKLLNFGLISSSIFLLAILASLIITITFIPQDVIDNSFEGIFKLISHKSIFIVVISLGVGLCICLVVFTRFKMKPENYLTFVPIVVFIICTEFINIPIIAYADYKSLKISFVASAVSSLATSFIKIWFNTIIISFAIRIVMPLITKKTFNGYE